MALVADRKLDAREYPPVEYGYLVQANARVFRGSIVAICSDFTIIPAGSVGTPAAVAIVGIAERQLANVPGAQLPGGIQSSLNAPGAVRCRRGTFQVPFDALPPASAIGSPVYAVDDQTVSLSNGATGGGAATHLQCGTLEGFDQVGNPWVKF